jgi:hypothetical protein
MNSMRCAALVVVLSGGLLLGGCTTTKVSAGQPVQVATSIEFHEYARPPIRVRQECNLDTRIPAAVAENNIDVQVVDRPSGSERELKMIISDIGGFSGGAWTGPKLIEVEGSLWDGGQKVASFEARRHSIGGAFALFRRTCSIYGMSASAMGRDIAVWLQDPQTGAQLGDYSRE